MTRPIGEVKVVGLFGEGDQIMGEDMNGFHGAVLFCCPDETVAIGPMVYQNVELVPVADIDALRAENAKLTAIADAAGDFLNAHFWADDPEDEEVEQAGEALADAMN